ncbi:transposase [Desulfitobacterium sp. Sab5]|uniref:transposase n=1 Tax=Desulfitobacterium nosdiversum TaxID=3375356 RepID=UPI003CF6F497
MPQKGKIAPQEKLKIIEQYLRGEIGCCDAGRQIGVDHRTITEWASRYKSEGAAAFLPQEHNRKYSRETKTEAVLDYLSGKGSLQEICEKYKIKSHTQLRNWLKAYNRHEDFKTRTGGSSMTKGRVTTSEERLQIVRECIANRNDYGGTALKYRVSYQQVYTWTKKYREMGETGLEDRRGHRAGTLPSRTPEEKLRDRVAQLERENYDLEMENALLKKVKELERRRY